MAEKDSIGSDAPGGPQIPSHGIPPAAPRRRRSKLALLLKIVGLLIVLLILLVLAAPTLLSTRPVLSTILKQVNKQLNGRVEVASLSLGWFTGVKVDGVKVLDANNAQIAQIDHTVIPYPLWKPIVGKLEFGQVVLDGVSFDAKIDSNGNLNFAQLAKPGAAPAGSSPAGPTPATESKSSKLPDISATLKLTNCTGTVSQPGKPTVYLTKLDGEIQIPNINQPISDTIDAAIKVGDQKPGTIALSGTAAVISQNQIALGSAQVHQKLDVENLDLQTAKPFIPATAGVDTIEGMLGIVISIDVTDGKTAAVDAVITGSKKISIGGKIFKGDTFSTDSFTAAIPKLSATFPNGLDKWQSGRIKVGTDAGASPILLKIDQGQITATADLVPQAILNLIDKQAPESSGQLALTSTFDLARILPQLAHTIPQAKGVTIQTAGVNQKLTLALSPEKAELSNSLDSTKIVGVQTVDGIAKQITVDAIHISTSGNDLGGGGAIPKLADLNLKIQSSFANGEFHGNSISDITGTLKANLKLVQDEISQFIDLKKTTFGGDVEVTIADKGQLTQAPAYQAGVNVNVAVHDLKYGDENGQIVNEPMVLLTLGANLQGSEKNTLEKASDVLLTLKTGDMNAPTVDLSAKTPTVNLIGNPAAEFTLNVVADLAKLQKEFAAVPAGSAGIAVNRGSFSLNLAGKYSGHTLDLNSCAISAEQLFIARQLPDGKQISAVAGDALHAGLAGAVDLIPTADGTATNTAVRLKQLTLADIASILDIHKTGDGDVLLSKSATGLVAGQGQLALFVQLGAVHSIQKALSQNEPDAKTAAGDLQSGKLTGTLDLSNAGENKTALKADFNFDGLVLTTATGVLPAQSTSVTLQATAENISVAAKSVFDQVQSATWQVVVPDIKPVMALSNAFSSAPAATTAKPDSSAAKPVAPMEYDSGAVSIKGDVSHQGSLLKVNVSELKATGVAFHRGDIHYAAKPIELALAASVDTTDGKQLLDQIRQVQITQLTGNLGIATLSMPAPIFISQLSSNPIAGGGVQLVGNLTDLTALMAAMQGQKPAAYPYRGDYTLTENITTQQNTVSLKGGLQIAHLQSYNGDTITFSEDLFTVGNDVALTTIDSDESIKIASLTAAMQSSGALNIALNGGAIQHLQTTRDMQLQTSVTYDLAKLWPIIQPIMGDQYKTLKITGQATKQFNISGSYPANQPSTVAIKTLHADGNLEVATFSYDGINMQQFIVPFTLDGGLLKTVYYNKGGAPTTAPAAIANSGTVDLSSLTLDLTQDPPRLTTPPNKTVIDGLTVNPIFADSFLAKVINNPLFSGAKDASGLCHLGVVDCTDLPLGNLVTLPSPDNTGKIDLTFSLTELQLGLPNSGLESILKQSTFIAQVNNATVSISKGIATEDIVFSTGQYNLEFKGSVRLKDQAFVPMSLIFPLKIIAAKTHLAKGNSGDFVPDTVIVPVEGTVSNPKYRFDKVIPKALADAAGKAITKGLLGGQKNNGDNSDPLGGLLNKLQKKNKNQQPQN